MAAAASALLNRPRWTRYAEVRQDGRAAGRSRRRTTCRRSAGEAPACAVGTMRLRVSRAGPCPWLRPAVATRRPSHGRSRGLWRQGRRAVRPRRPCGRPRRPRPRSTCRPAARDRGPIRRERRARWICLSARIAGTAAVTRRGRQPGQRLRTDRRPLRSGQHGSAPEGRARSVGRHIALAPRCWDGSAPSRDPPIGYCASRSRRGRAGAMRVGRRARCWPPD